MFHRPMYLLGINRAWAGRAMCSQKGLTLSGFKGTTPWVLWGTIPTRNFQLLPGGGNDVRNLVATNYTYSESCKLCEIFLKNTLNFACTLLARKNRRDGQITVLTASYVLVGLIFPTFFFLEDTTSVKRAKMPINCDDGSSLISGCAAKRSFLSSDI